MLDGDGSRPPGRMDDSRSIQRAAAAPGWGPACWPPARSVATPAREDKKNIRMRPDSTAGRLDSGASGLVRAATYTRVHHDPQRVRSASANEVALGSPSRSVIDTGPTCPPVRDFWL
jgi:hypothetical protein